MCFYFVQQKPLKWTFKTWFWVQNHLLNLCSCVVNSQRLFVVKKLLLNIRIKAFWYYTIIHFLPVFGCLGVSAWNCITNVYSNGSFFCCSNQDFSAKGVIKGLCVCGVASESTPKARKSRLEKKTIPRSRLKHRDTISGKVP